MNPVKDYQDVLQNIEFVVIQVWREHPEMTNYSVMRAYDAAIAYYHALARKQTPKPVNLTGLDVTVFALVKEVCDWRLGRGSEPGRDLPEGFEPLPLEDLVACLRRLRKSVDFWTKEGGRQGYLQYIDQFLP
ncbi:MAG TPA: hypothetical protein VNT26_16200 [Candidatus Sulfotelmatobacter sp.]|nr:hypothetical protein [Candidatus Sulfotelmatobacter sp.]